MGRTEHEIIKSVWAEIEKATGGILNLSLIVSSSMSSQWLKPMAPSLTFVLCHVTRVDLSQPFETRNTNNETESVDVWLRRSPPHMTYFYVFPGSSLSGVQRHAGEMYKSAT